MNSASSEIIDVLLIEDDPGDAVLVQEALAGSGGSALRCHCLT